MLRYFPNSYNIPVFFPWLWKSVAAFNSIRSSSIYNCLFLWRDANCILHCFSWMCFRRSFVSINSLPQWSPSAANLLSRDSLGPSADFECCWPPPAFTRSNAASELERAGTEKSSSLSFVRQPLNPQSPHINTSRTTFSMR